jgi:rhamnogalacturonan endolyase
MKSHLCLFALLVCGLFTAPVAARQPAEKMDRGLVAVPRSALSVYVGWRLLKDDPADIGFNLYRSTAGAEPVKLNDRPITQSTNFVDDKAPLDQPNQWRLFPVLAGAEQAVSAAVDLPAGSQAQTYIVIPFQGDYVCSKVAVADLNGDGRYDFVIKQPQQIADPGVWRKSTDTFKVEAYLHDGTFLWRKDLGWNIEQGVWWSPMIVYDFDGDGRAEVALKTAPTDVDYRNPDDHDWPGRVMSGPEYVSILDGMTGKELDRADWPARGDISDWGDSKNNRASRHLIGAAYLDGKRPSLLVLRGTYTLMRVDAYNLNEKKLQKVWSWSGDDEDPNVHGQGMHGMHAADIDGDGRDEIILGSAVLDDNGKILWSTGLGHPDGCYVTDIYPDRPGLEIMYGIEPDQPKNAICVADARTGQILWGCDHPTTHVHSQGLFGNFDPDSPGFEYYTGEKDRSKHWTYSVDGKLLSAESLSSLAPTPLYWLDGPLKMIAERDTIRQYNGPQVGAFEGRILAVADILGDWREELITTVPGQLRIYTTTAPSQERHVAFMQDDIYRLDVAMVSMGYFYPPQLSYYFDPKITAAKKP